jgi:hypothetical protein
MTKSEQENYSKRESEQRFHKLVGIALKTPPKTQKAMGKKGVAAHSKKRKIKKRA